jgi:hypothetical protein
VTAERPEVVFVCGCDRSGTTLTANLLAGSDPAAVVIPEAQFVVGYLLEARGIWDAPRFVELLRTDARFAMWQLPLDAGLERRLLVADDVGDALAVLAAAHHGLDGPPAVVVDQTPWSIAYVDLLRRHVPGARFVNVVRDGRAVHASLRDLPWGPNTAAQMAVFWMARLAQGAFAGAALGPSRFTTVRYEDVVLDTDATLAGVWAAFGRSVEAGAEAPAGDGFVAAQAGGRYHPRLAGGIDAARIEAWRRSLAPHEIETFEFWAGDVLAHHGYELVHGGYAGRPSGRRRLQDGVREFVRFYAVNPARRRRDQRSISS